MSAFDVGELLDRVIDQDAFFLHFEEWLMSGDAAPRTIVASAIAHLDCGHQRPTNMRYELGELEFCYGCGVASGKRRVVNLDLLPETTTFPHPDSLHDLPEVAA